MGWCFNAAIYPRGRRKSSDDPPSSHLCKWTLQGITAKLGSINQKGLCYISVKNLSFYLTDAEITLRRDHLPLKKFLLKNTFNSKVNNWAVELETFNIKFEHILGIKNTLADIKQTLSRIIKVNPDVQPECEKEEYEFGYSCFEELLPVEVFEVEEKIVKDVKLQPDVDIEIPEMECTLPVPTAKLHELQLKDELCQKKARQVNTNTDTSRSYYIDRDGVLQKIFEDNEEVFQTTVLPKILIDPVLQLTHSSAGHNGFQWVYLSIRHLCYWNSMKKDILHHCKQWDVYEKFKVECIKFEKHTKSANGIHLYGSNWGIQSTNQQGSQICLNSDGYADGLCHLCTTQVKEGRRCNSNIP